MTSLNRKNQGPLDHSATAHDGNVGPLWNVRPDYPVQIGRMG